MKNIRRSTKWADLVVRYTTTIHPKTGRAIFPTIREFMAFAAVVGVAAKRKNTIAGPCDELDSRNYAGTESFMETMYMIALADTNSPEILSDQREEEMISIFESYCDGGLEIIAQWQRETPTDTTGEQALIDGLSSLQALTAVPSTERLIERISF